MIKNKGISSTVSSIILVATVVAVTLATAAWISGFSFTFMQIEELRVTNHNWSPDCSYVDVTLRNTGTQFAKLSTVLLNNQLAPITYVSGSSSINPGETAILRVTSNFIVGDNYQFSFLTQKGNRFFLIATPTETSSVFRMEWGTTTTNDTFQTVNLEKTFVSPIIICTPHYNSGSPRTVRLTDVSSTSFKIKVQSPSNESLPNTLVSYLVVEEGVWMSPFKIEAGKYTTETVGENNNWAYDLRDYGQTKSGKIVILHQVMSQNDPSWISTYVSKSDNRKSPPSSSDSNFRIALNGAEAVDSHDAEELGYIILEEDYDLLSSIKYEVKQTSDSICGFANSPPYYTSLSQSFSQPPNVIISCQQEADGGDGGWNIIYTVTESQIGLAIDEDQVKDSDRSHTTETCGFITFETIGSYEE